MIGSWLALFPVLCLGGAIVGWIGGGMIGNRIARSRARNGAD